ncbi:hypothetical protein [Nocardia aurea]|uniref:Secreted protein n=1 Tax=Nocardia aurea TaxID=2144174 RepID=A0ABV3G0Q9_9NOCA
MRTTRLFGTALAAAGIILSGVAVASADARPQIAEGAADVADSGSATGSANVITGLSNLLSTGSGSATTWPLPAPR